MTAKDIILRALSTLGWTALGYLIVVIPFWLIVLVGVAISEGA